MLLPAATLPGNAGCFQGLLGALEASAVPDCTWMRTSFWIRADASPPLTMVQIFCISKHLIFTVLEQAAMDSWFALVTCMNVIGYKVIM